ncbi:MAG: hypothetical protein PV344_07500, partial [Anaplasma sp.]|nr:hypothetical protein [Anaplasma sp.]
MTSRGNFKLQHSRDVTSGMKEITRCHFMRIKGCRMSQMISLYQVIHLLQKKNLKNLWRDSNPRPTP